MTKSTQYMGLSIIEILVALSILSIALVSVVPVFINHAAINRRTEVRAEAVTAAERVMDGLRQRSFGDWPAYRATIETSGVLVVMGEDGDSSDDGRIYTPVIEWCTVDLPLCDADQDEQRHVRVTIRRNAQDLYDVKTVFAAVRRN